MGDETNEANEAHEMNETNEANETNEGLGLGMASASMPYAKHAQPSEVDAKHVPACGEMDAKHAASHEMSAERLESLIRAQWTNGSGGFGQVEVWDEAAAGYAEKPIPSFEEDEFLRFLADEGVFGACSPAGVPERRSDMTVLDIGCGSGLYSIAIAPFVKRVVGCDLSPKMVEAARAKAQTAGCENVEFVCGDFAALCPDQLSVRVSDDSSASAALDDAPQGFDLVFAHFTPALSDVAAFDKMVSLARTWCFVAMPVRRHDPVLEQARQLVSISPFDAIRDRNFLFAFSLAWLAGKTPSVRHYDDVWIDTRELEDAKRIYSEYLVSPDLDERQKKLVRDHLDRIAVGGQVVEEIRTQAIMAGWRV